MHRAGKLGLGTAYVEGFGWGLARGYEYLFEMDADGSHDPKYLPQMLALAEDGADVVVGSRNVPGGGTDELGRRAQAPLARAAASTRARSSGSTSATSPRASSAGGARALEAIDLPTDRLQRLQLPDRDEVPRAQAGLPHRRDPDRVRRSPGRASRRCRARSSPRPCSRCGRCGSGARRRERDRHWRSSAAPSDTFATVVDGASCGCASSPPTSGASSHRARPSPSRSSCRRPTSSTPGEQVIVEISSNLLPNKVLIRGTVQAWRPALPRMRVRAGATVAARHRRADQADVPARRVLGQAHRRAAPPPPPPAGPVRRAATALASIVELRRLGDLRDRRRRRAAHHADAAAARHRAHARGHAARRAPRRSRSRAASRITRRRAARACASSAAMATAIAACAS